MVSRFPATSTAVTLSPEDFRFGIMAIGLWPYALSVLYPARMMKSVGLYKGREIGRFPWRVDKNRRGQFFSRHFTQPVFMEGRRSIDDRDFDRLAEVYDSWVGPCSTPVVAESLELVELLTREDSTILDLGCGPGREIPGLAALVPRGEVVGADLSAEMIRAAFDYSMSLGIHNTAFFQADAEHLPGIFRDKFDLVFCSNTFHHYQNPEECLFEMRGTLRDGGKAIVVDPGISAFYGVSELIARWGDPGFVSFYAAEELREMFLSAGFWSYYWTELLPGIGVSIGTK